MTNFLQSLIFFFYSILIYTSQKKNVRIWSQLVKKLEIQIPSQWISYMVVILIFHYYCEIDIGTTYKMMHNNDLAERQENA